MFTVRIAFAGEAVRRVLRHGRHPSVRAVMLAVAWFVVIQVIGFATARLPFSVESPWGSGVAAPPLARFDAGWYASIAEHGYSLDPAGGQSNVAFFPLYPLMAGTVAAVLRLSFFNAALLVSLASLLTAVALLAADESRGTWSGLGAVVALLAWPGSFFLAAAYTEALFLALALATYTLAKRGHWLGAGVAGFLAALCRPHGVLLALLLLPSAYAAFRTGMRSPCRAVFSVLSPVAGLATFLAYLGTRFGDPFVGMKSYAAWGRTPGRGAEVVAIRIRDLSERLLGLQRGYGLLEGVELASVLLFGVLTLLVLRSGRLGEFLYASGVLAMAVSSGSLVSAHRYVLVLFPCFAILGAHLARSRVLLVSYVLVGLGLGSALLTRFVLWVFVG